MKQVLQERQQLAKPGTPDSEHRKGERQKEIENIDDRQIKAANITQFTWMVKSTALNRLARNRLAVQKRMDRYQTPVIGQEGQELYSSPRWVNVRKVILTEKNLHTLQEELRFHKKNLQLATSFLGPKIYFEEIAALEKKIAVINELREKLKIEYPEAAVLNCKDIIEETSDAAIQRQILEGFGDVLDAMDDVEKKLQDGSIPYYQLKPVTDFVKRRLNINEQKRNAGDRLSIDVLDWLESEEQFETLYQWAGTSLTIVCSIGAFFATGGWVILLGIAGAAAGVGSAAFHFDLAQDVFQIAKSQEISENKLISESQAEHARFDYHMSIIDLALAGLDLSLAGRSVGTLVKARRVKGELAGALNGSLLQQLESGDIVQFSRAYQLERIGKTREAQQIFETLEQKLGKDTFKQTRRVFHENKEQLQLERKIAKQVFKGTIDSSELEDLIRNHIKVRDYSKSKRGIGTRGDIAGCHDMTEFAKYKDEYEIVSMTPHPTAKGVFHVKYRMYAVDKELRPTKVLKKYEYPKTVYDPTIWSDQKLYDAVLEAAEDAISQGKFLREWEGITSAGLKIKGFQESGKIKTFYFKELD